LKDFKFLILVIYHLDTMFTEQGCEDPWLFFSTSRNLWAKIFGKHCVRFSTCWSLLLPWGG